MYIIIYCWDEKEKKKHLRKKIDKILYFLLISLPTMPSSGQVSRHWRMEKMKPN